MDPPDQLWTRSITGQRVWILQPVMDPQHWTYGHLHGQSNGTLSFELRSEVANVKSIFHVVLQSFSRFIVGAGSRENSPK